MTLELFKLKDPLSDIFTPEFDIAVVSFTVGGETKYTIYDLLLHCKSSLNYEQVISISTSCCIITTHKLFKVYDLINECKLNMKFINKLPSSRIENLPPVFDRKINERYSMIRYSDMIRSGNIPIIKPKKVVPNGAGVNYKQLNLSTLNREQLIEVASAIKIFSRNRKDPRLKGLFDQLKELYRSERFQ